MFVLVADDEPLIRRNIVRQIGLSGGCIITAQAYNGLDVINHLREEAADLIISDIRMPGMDGLELARQVREEYPWMEMMIVSGYDEFEYAVQALRYGVSDYILKPMEPEKFRSSLSQLAATAQEHSSKELARLSNMLDAPSLRSLAKLALEQDSAFAGQLREYCLALFQSRELLRNSPYLRLALVEQYCRQLAEQVTGPEGWEEWVVEEPLCLSQAEEAIASLIRQFCQTLWRNMESSSGSSLMFYRVRAYIDAHFTEDIGLEEIAQQTNYNKNYISAAFKKQGNQTVLEYIQEKRMQAAKERLAHSNCKVFEVAQQVGYRDINYFIRLFKGRYGITPQAFKKLQQGGNAHEG